MARLDRIGDVFGDGTRRGIYRHVLSAEQPLSASEVAEAFGLHRTVARAHLERMVEVGLVQVGLRRRPTGGRPAKVYSPGKERVEVAVPARRYEALARLLLRLVADTTPEPRAVQSAVDVGYAHGVDVAHTFSDAKADRFTPHEAVGWMTKAGYRVKLEECDGASATIDVANCVYQELALEYPDLVCAFDRGMFCGMLGASLEGHEQPMSLLAGDDICRHRFKLQA
jgi:predicted ArsR family transcriptional regulator